MRIALVIGLCLLPLCATQAGSKDQAKDQAKPTPQDRPSAQNIRQAYRAKLNDNTVTIMSGAARGTEDRKSVV